MNYTIYDSSTGQIIATTSTNDPAQLPPSDSYIEGSYSGKLYYINNGVPTLILTKPSAFLQSYTFNWTTKTWDVDVDTTASQVRSYRDLLLNQTVDKLNPVWWASLTADQQAEATAYRQALLNVPTQTGFPTDVVWPTKPTWM